MSEDMSNEDSNGIANLRKQYDAKVKELESATTELATFRSEKRQTSVVDILKAKGIDEKKAVQAAKLYREEDASEDAVGKWVEEYADVLGISSGQQNDQNAQNAQRVAAASFGNQATVQVGPEGALGDPAEIQNLIETLPYDELVKLGIMPKPGVLFNPVR